jgi:hypothetical protein
MLFEDENESEDESERDRRASTTKTCVPTRRAVIRLANFTGRRESESKRRPSLELAPISSDMSSAPASVQSVISLPDTADTSSCLEAARRRWELLSLRVSLRVFRAKQQLASGLHVRRTVPVV